MGIYDHVPDPHIEERKDEGPVRVSDQLSRGNRVTRFNARAALVITNAVGTMWCAYFFALFDCLALPQALHGGLYGMVQWAASFFLQLVLLSIIMVGQSSQARASDKRAEQTYKDTEVILSEVLQIHGHLEAQDKILARLNGQAGKRSLPPEEEVS